MLDQLSEKFEKILKKLRGTGVLTEENIAEALKEVRLALLEADVNFKIVKDFVERVRQKAIGQEVLQSLTPGHQVVKVVWDELRAMMGQERAGLSLASMPPTVVMMVGLQGSGKTTSCGKLAKYFKHQGKRVLLVAADPRRPAAADQLSSIGRSLDVDVHRQDQPGTTAQDVVRVCRDGVERGRSQGFDLVVLDTGGRLHVDDELMNELASVKTAVMPNEVLLVADAMTGQDAVTMASQFDQRVGLTGIILTKVEGDARGGALLSIRAVTGKPVKFLGLGEKLDALELFHPDRMASRAQLGQVNKLGSLDQILGMLPGGQKLKGAMEGQVPERELKRVMAMIDSMTMRERRDHTVINGSRKKRIARGSGTNVMEVNRLIKQFLSARKIAKVMTGTAGRHQLAQLLRSM